MRVAVPVTSNGQLDQTWGRAARVAVGDVEDGRVVGWQEFTVGWDVAHDSAGEGSHHARIARFLQDNSVEVVAASHMGPPMVQMLGQMGIRVVLDVQPGDARVVAANVTGGPSTAS